MLPNHTTENPIFKLVELQREELSFLTTAHTHFLLQFNKSAKDSERYTFYQAAVNSISDRHDKIVNEIEILKEISTRDLFHPKLNYNEFTQLRENILNTILCDEIKKEELKEYVNEVIKNYDIITKTNLF